MALLIALLLLIGSLILLRYSKKLTNFLTLITVLLALYVVIVGLQFLFRGLEYESWKAQRDSFEITLKNSRNTNNPLESTTITDKIVEYNSDLAYYKYHRKLLLIKDAVDPRFEKLDFIK